ncbi:MAG: hypothetical protein P4M15_11565 [Alphaproteobacteria bacterium]|nr:hypothetical protein [Alphaproteobacteria bacterium]
MVTRNTPDFVEKNATDSCSALAMAVMLAKQGMPVFLLGAGRPSRFRLRKVWVV